MAVIAVLLQPGQAQAVATGSAGYAWGDFNNDGFGDLAIGAPGESLGRASKAGVVHVIYGTTNGLSSRGTDIWSQDTKGIPGTAEAGDSFGASLAAGDWDGDGVDDLAIGSPGESIGSAKKAGTVTVLYGRQDSGLSKAGRQLLRQGGTGISGAVESGDAFGSTLVAGDFNNDGETDLAVAAVGETIGSTRAGVVQILNGTAPGGLTGTNGETIHQGSDGIEGANESGDRFGHALTVGDFDDDEYDDLAIGAPFEGIGDHSNAGSVTVVYGSISGPDTLDSHMMTQATVFAEDETDTNDAFGYSLAAGNFGPDSDLPAGAYDDLVIGVPGDLSDSSGAVNVVYGSSEGFVEQAEVWHQNASGENGAVAGTREAGDDFGYAVAANDFNGDGRCDLAIGVPGEDEPSANEGGVITIYGTPIGLEPGGVEPNIGPSQFITQDTAGIRGVGESGDAFGAMLSSGRFDDDNFSDLVIGARGEDLGRKKDAGAVTVIYGRAIKVSGAGSQIWHQDSPGIRGKPESGDRFGASGA